jgi:imidazolonepropionase-like amidohydrolase
MVRVEGQRITAVDRRRFRRGLGHRPSLGDASAGLIDLHTHLTGQRSVTGRSVLTKTTPGHAPRVRAMRSSRLRRLHDGARHGADLAIRRCGPARRDRSVARCPDRVRLRSATTSPRPGRRRARQFSIYVDVPLVKNLADGPDEIVKAVRTNFKNGADFIKILATGAVPRRHLPAL